MCILFQTVFIFCFKIRVKTLNSLLLGFLFWSFSFSVCIMKNLVSLMKVKGCIDVEGAGKTTGMISLEDV
jgi:hypothetical protein